MIQLLGRGCGQDASTWKRGASLASAGVATRTMADTRKAVLMFSSRRSVVLLQASSACYHAASSTSRGNILLRADAGLGDDAAPLLDIAAGALGDGFRRPGLGRHALRDQCLLAFGRIEDVVHRAIEPGDDGRRRRRRCNERNP